MNPRLAKLFLLSCGLLAFGPGAAASAPTANLLLQLPDIEISDRRIGYSIGTDGSEMMTIVDEYRWPVADADGTPVPVDIRSIVVVRPAKPYQDEVKDPPNAAPARPFTPRPGAFAKTRLQLSGAWFEASGYGVEGTRDSRNAMIYSGHKYGLAYILDIKYDGDKLPVETVRAAFERVVLDEPAATAVPRLWWDFATVAVAGARLQTNLGPLAFDGSGDFKLKQVERGDSGDPTGPGFFRVTYAQDKVEIRLSCRPGLQGVQANRDRLEAALFRTASTSGFEQLSSQPVAGGELRHVGYERADYSGKHPEQAWTRVLGDQFFLVEVSGRASKRVTKALQELIATPELRCQSLDPAAR